MQSASQRRAGRIAVTGRAAKAARRASVSGLRTRRISPPLPVLGSAWASRCSSSSRSVHGP
jgi:hypothetical protein